ncbi:MAG: Eco57I restriction-modification methylase domain-containing protein, partial [Chloroflexota bacterium]|nr:Eco57I restriction-modification methylase domain-containing protein [Chloroflexota bacterium]
LYTATRYGLKIDSSLWKSLVDFATDRIVAALPQFSEWRDQANTIATQHSFFHWELEFPEVFFDKYGQPKREWAGFDAVIGNPPWIRQEMFSADKTALKQYSVYHGVADLSTYFVELGNTHLREQGYFGFIIPNKFVRANYGAALRKFLMEQVRVERLVDFGDLPVFAEATTYPMIVLTTKQPVDDSAVKFTYLKHIPSADDMKADIVREEKPITRASLTEAQWHLAEVNMQGIVEKIKTAGVPLGEYVNGKIFYGIKTGFNEAFVIDRRTRDQLIAQDRKSAEIIKPFVAGRDIKRYRVDYQERYIILTKIGTPIERYPAVFAHLQKYQSQLEERWDKGNHWWELRACAYYEEFEKPKIMFPDIANRSQFALDTDGIYSTNTTYFIPVHESQKYLFPLLNSSLIEFFFRTISASIRGGYMRFFYQYMTQIPIRRIIFTTPVEERKTLVSDGKSLHEQGKHEELLTLVGQCLAAEPEQSDVVHDLLVYLAEQMISSTTQRHEAIEDFLLDLRGVILDTEVQKLRRLWTPLRPPAEGDKAAEQKHAEARQVLGALAEQQLELDEDIGSLSEEQWIWLLRGRLGSQYSLTDVVKVYRRRQLAIAAADARIAAMDALINAMVYRLYGLTEEEIALVEGKELAHPQSQDRSL